MTPKHFRARVLAHESKDLPPSSLRRAAEIWLSRRGTLSEAGIDACIELAELLERYHQDSLRELDLQSQPEPYRQRLAANGANAVGEVMASDLAVEAITPRIEQIREELFGSTSPPFMTYDAAVEWLVRLGNEQRRRWQERHEQKQREYRERGGRGHQVGPARYCSNKGRKGSRSCLSYIL